MYISIHVYINMYTHIFVYVYVSTSCACLNVAAIRARSDFYFPLLVASVSLRSVLGT